LLLNNSTLIVFCQEIFNLVSIENLLHKSKGVLNILYTKTYAFTI